jgi:PiT family inorganic phosphate transporter
MCYPLNGAPSIVGRHPFDRWAANDGASIMVGLTLLVLMTLFVAYSNGANDNFKGVATLYGAHVTDYRTAIVLGTVATFAGCMASVFLADALVQAFSGRGLVPDPIAGSQPFVLGVATGAGATVLLATFLGLPISTTHSLTGALVGAGFVAAGDQLNLGLLGAAFFLPLLVSPLISLLMTMPLYAAMHHLSTTLGITKQKCVCIAPGQFLPARQFVPESAIALRGYDHAPATSVQAISMGTAPQCVEKYGGKVFGITAQTLIDSVHYISAAAVSFARGLNDTPKIVGLLLVLKALDLRISMLAIAIAMAIGGLINARRVAETMSKRISSMNDGQALTANLVTAFLVIFASRFGLPVSTTHVSVGAITGIGVVNGSANKRMIAGILSAWLLTLPMAALISALSHLLYRAML